MSGLLFQGVAGVADTTILGAPGPDSGTWDSAHFPQEDPKLREECGVIAIHGHPDAARQAYLGLYALQHRGQESAGIATADGQHLANIKGMGLVSEIFTDEVLAKLPGPMAIGHTRYSTTGDSALLNAQPIRVDSTKGLIAIAHNGNLVNLGNVRARLERDGAYHQGTVWPWLIGAFVEAWVKVRGSTPEAKTEARARFVEPLRRHLEHAGLGHVSEIADAEAPFLPRGCPFQAWSVGELLRLERVVLASEP